MQRLWQILIRALAGRQWVSDGGKPSAAPGGRLDDLLKAIRRDTPPGTSPPLDRAADIGRHCGAAEIESLLERLDGLARDRQSIPAWDGDASDDIAKAQSFFSQILSTVPKQQVPAVAGGLKSAFADTQLWVALALEAHGSEAALMPLAAALEQEKDPGNREMLASIIDRLGDRDPI